MAYMVASVARRSGSFSLTMSNEFNRPTAIPNKSGTRRVTKISCRYKTREAALAIVARLTVEPTDKSKPSTIRENVMPMATSVTIEMDRKISLKIFIRQKNDQA